jgi:hypothetical protein
MTEEERFERWERQLNTDWLAKCSESYAEYGREKAAELDRLRATKYSTVNKA